MHREGKRLTQGHTACEQWSWGTCHAGTPALLWKHCRGPSQRQAKGLGFASLATLLCFLLSENSLVTTLSAPAPGKLQSMPTLEDSNGSTPPSPRFYFLPKEGALVCYVIINDHLLLSRHDVGSNMCQRHNSKTNT